jgi:hypothetical protein
MMMPNSRRVSSMDAKEKQRLAEIEERCKGISRGPWWQKSWKQETHPDPNALELSQLLCYLDDEGVPRFWNWNTDGEFVAHAREDIPFLLGEVAALRTELDELRKVASEVVWSNGDADAVWGLRDVLVRNFSLLPPASRTGDQH